MTEPVTLEHRALTAQDALDELEAARCLRPRLPLGTLMRWLATLRGTLGTILPRRHVVEDVGFISLPEAAQRYSIPLPTLQHAAKQGRLPARRVGRQYLARVEDVAQFAAALKPRPSRRKQA